MYEFLEETVANNMTGAVRSVTPETTIGDLYRLFAADDFEAYPVVEKDELIGMVSKLDALKVFAFEHWQARRRSPVETCHSDKERSHCGFNAGLSAYRHICTAPG